MQVAKKFQSLYLATRVPQKPGKEVQNIEHQAVEEAMPRKKKIMEENVQIAE